MTPRTRFVPGNAIVKKHCILRKSCLQSSELGPNIAQVLHMYCETLPGNESANLTQILLLESVHTCSISKTGNIVLLAALFPLPCQSFDQYVHPHLYHGKRIAWVAICGMRRALVTDLPVPYGLLELILDCTFLIDFSNVVTETNCHDR